MAWYLVTYRDNFTFTFMRPNTDCHYFQNW
jgi:hypothetical protein